MKRYYVFIIQKQAYLVTVVTSDMVCGRYQIVMPNLNIKYKYYESMDEVHIEFDTMVRDCYIDAWYPLDLSI